MIKLIRIRGLDSPLAVTLSRVGLFLVVGAAGWAVAELSGLRVVDSSGNYVRAVTVLLAIGLFASVYDIDVSEALRQRRTVFVAITVGVLLKAAIIAGVMYLFFREPAFLVLGIAVAQIDPLSFAALGRRSSMSREVRTILAAWSSFDDPVTVLLTVYISGWVLTRLHTGDAGDSSLVHLSGSVAEFGGTVLRNVLFVLVAYALWRLSRVGAGATPGRLRNAIQIALLVLLAAFAIWQFLMLGLAVAALFFRPVLGVALRWLATIAFQLATFALGLLLVSGVNVRAGIVLGAAAFGAQIVVGSLIAARRSRRDRTDVALGQQSGITAVLLALLLEDSFPGTVAVVAPAIVTINVLHALANGFGEKAPAPPPPVPDAGEPSPGRAGGERHAGAQEEPSGLKL
jgi:hypothetical protein